MHPIIRNIAAIVLGIIIGSVANMGIIMLSGSIIAPPAAADLTSTQGLQEAMHLFTPKHFIMPFLAHALGTFVGALVAAFVAASHKMYFALSIALVFLAGGIMMVMQLPSPLWFNVLDIAGAYLPFGYLAGRIASRQN